MPSRRSPTRAGVAALLIAVLVGALMPVAVAAASPQVSIGDVSVVEPAVAGGRVTVDVPVTVHGATAGAIAVQWQTAAASATSADFVVAAGTLNIPAGAAGGLIPVQVKTDTTVEGWEQFNVVLTGATGAGLGASTGTVYIGPSVKGLAVGDVAVTEPDAGTLKMTVPVTLAATAKYVRVNWTLKSSTATLGSDAVAASGSITIRPLTVATRFTIKILGDTDDEGPERLQLQVTGVVGTTVSDAYGDVTIRNTDVWVPPPPPPPVELLDWTPPAAAIQGSNSVLYVESPTGDFVGQGGTYRYTKVDSVMNFVARGGRFDLGIGGDEGWNLSVAEPSTNTQIVTGYWEDVGRYPFHVPGVSFTGEGRGCNTVLGAFTVDSVTYSAPGLLEHLVARFEQRCEGGSPPLRGYLRWNASDTSQPPPPGNAAAFPWSPPAGSVPATGNYLYMKSAPGDYIGQGRTELYTPANRTFTANASGIRFSLGLSSPSNISAYWTLDLAGRYNQTQLTAGLYEDVQRYPFHNTARGGLSFSGEHRGCNELVGDFAIDEIAYDGSGLVSIRGRFVQYCETIQNPPLYGAFRWTRP